MTHIFAVTNQKGGVGKTTTSVNLSACLAGKGQRVLLVDIDPQGNATSGLGVERGKLESCIYDLLLNEKRPDEVILESRIPRLSIMPATLDLAGAEIELVSAMSREYRLKQVLEKVADRYDYVLIDSPPSLGLLTVNALTAADAVLIPIQCEYYALEGISQLLRTVHLVRQHLNPSLAIAGVLLTMHDPRTNLSQQVIEEVRAHFGPKVFETIIPRNIRLSEAPSHGVPITFYDPKSKGAEAYQSLAQEVIEAGNRYRA
jgi:chromosome partitioning protein